MKLLSSMIGAGLLLGATGCPNQARNDSVTAMNEGNTAYGAKQYETAVVAFKKAVDRYHDNHSAWYGLGGALLKKGDFVEAANAFDTAVQLAPEQPMYQMWDGVALYEKAVNQAREDEAKKEGKKPEEVKPDLSNVHFDKAKEHLDEAIKLNPDMWHAHYYLGRIARASDQPKLAAEEFTKALQANGREPEPYVALGELYRHWDYTDQAIAVTSQGTTNVPGSDEVSDIWFVLGMGYDDKRLDDKAIEAFGKALESKRDNHQAEFQRGQAYFRKGDLVNAKKDLESFSKSGGASLEFAKSQANKMLMDIAAKSAGPAPTPEQAAGPGGKKPAGGFQPPPRKK
jgi:tetratricopeptide (TPR) repeat protein